MNNLEEERSQLERERRKKELSKVEIRELFEKIKVRLESDIDEEGDWELENLSVG